MTGNLLNIPCTTLSGEQKTLADFPGKAVLVVNTASKCGFTPQYKGLEALWQQYRDQGLVILGFPCNQFGKQEPGDAAAIAEFCELNFGVTFPLAAKTDVNGADANPIFALLTDNGAAPIKWNFEKFLITNDGGLQARFESAVTPDSPELVAAVEAALA